MIDMLQNAKDLINKGKALNDSDLVQMGMDLLEQYSPKHTDDEEPWNLPVPSEKRGTMAEIVLTPVYICENCGHEMPIDKPGRKRCPECKKHQLKVVEPVPPAQPERYLPNAQDLTTMFTTQIRNNKNRTITTDDGEKRTYTKAEPVEGIANVWEDDLTEEQDAANELLKKFTKRSPRTRQPTNFIDVKCDQCGKLESMHPLHAGGRSRHLCTRCVSKRAQV